MKHSTLLFMCLLFATPVSFGQNQKYVSYQLSEEYQKKQVTVSATKSDVYYFESGVLLAKINKGQSKKILVKDPSAILFSRKSIATKDLYYQGKDSYNSFLTSRNQAIAKIPRLEKILSIWLLLLIVLLAMIRTKSLDIFYGFVVPWVAYTNTEEIIGKMNPRNMLLPIALLMLNLFALVWMFNPLFTWLQLLYSFALIIGVFVFKVLILSVLEYLFDANGFARKQLLQFLKFGIMFSMLMFGLRFIEVLNHWQFEVIYKIGVLLYIIVWLISLGYNFYADGKQKVIQFFSYLCVSEAIPLIMVLALWKS